MTTPRYPRLNPYIGPRSFEPGERLYGRDTETRKLANLLGAERVVLLHSPSGAGKTSLIQAALIPRMRERKFHVRPIARVNHEAAQHSSNGYNRYVFSALSSLESEWPDDEQLPDKTLAGLTLPAYLAQRPKPAGVSFELLIFDQFEEILTLDPTDQAAKHAFFAQLGEALEDRTCWALFSMREDFLGALAPYLIPIPNRLSVTFRLDLLGETAARQALQQPVRAAGAEFDDAAAQALVDDLRRVQIQRPDGTLEAQLGPYVEPVQLQVVGYRLWESLAADDTQIDQADLTALGDVGHALAEYYAGRVAAIAQESGVSERAIRTWCDRQLITEQGIRGQVLMGKERSEGLENHAVRLLENAHLVRAEKRGGATWYELAHDRLIEPVRKDNAAWFAIHLSLLQRQAQLWADERRPDSLLLRGKELQDAEAWAATHAGEVTETEREFLADSRAARASRQAQVRANRRLRTALIASVLIALVAVLFMLAAVIFGVQAYQSNQTAQGRLLASLSARKLDDGDKPLATLLAYQALQNYPYTVEAEGALGNIVRPQQQVRSFASQPGALKGAVLNYSAAFSPDGARVVTTTEDGTVQVWDVASGKLLVALIEEANPESDAAISPDGARVVTRGYGEVPLLWDAATGKELVAFSIELIFAKTMVFSPDGTRILMKGGNDAWIADAASGQVLARLPGYVSDVGSAPFSADGARVVAINELTGYETVRVWDTVSGQVLAIIDGHTSSITNAALSPDGHRVVTTHYDDEIARVWDAASGNELATLSGHVGSVTSAAFSPDSRRIVTTSDDQTARVWDTASGKLLTMLSGHTDSVYSAAFSPDGARVVTASEDGTARIWDVEHGLELFLISGSPSRVRFMAFDADGSHLLIGREDGLVQYWQLWPSRQALLAYAQLMCGACELNYQQRTDFRIYNWPMLVFEYRQILIAFWLGLLYVLGGWMLYRDMFAHSDYPAPVGYPGFSWKHFAAVAGQGGLVVALAVTGTITISAIEILYFGNAAEGNLRLVTRSQALIQLLFVLPLGLLAGAVYSHRTRFHEPRRRWRTRILLGGLAGLLGNFFLVPLVMLVFFLANRDTPEPMSVSLIFWLLNSLFITLIVSIPSGIMSLISAALYIFSLQPLATRWLARANEDE
jgi:WD40 repeat protein